MCLVSHRRAPPSRRRAGPDPVEYGRVRQQTCTGRPVQIRVANGGVAVQRRAFFEFRRRAAHEIAAERRDSTSPDRRTTRWGCAAWCRGAAAAFAGGPVRMPARERDGKWGRGRSPRTSSRPSRVRWRRGLFANVVYVAAWAGARACGAWRHDGEDLAMSPPTRPRASAMRRPISTTP